MASAAIQDTLHLRYDFIGSFYFGDRAWQAKVILRINGDYGTLVKVWFCVLIHDSSAFLSGD